ncbi:protein FAM161B isoform X2 [Ascaphus truei]
MQKSVFIRAKALDPHQSLADTNTEKLKQNWQNNLKRMNEYKEELEQMKKRVEVRPYLFEHVKKGSAVKSAERRFTAALRRAEITEEFVQHIGGEAGETSESEERQADADETSADVYI